MAKAWEKKMKKAIVLTMAIFALLIMVSEVTAVPYTNEEKMLSASRGAKEKIQNIMDSKFFASLEKFVEKNMQSGNEAFVSQTMKKFCAKISMDDADYYHFLIVITEIILLVLGHNIIGRSMAMLTTMFTAMPFALWQATIETVVIFGIFGGWIAVGFIGILTELLDMLLGNGLHIFGFLAVVPMIALLLIGMAIAAILSVPIVLVAATIKEYIDAINYILGYIFGGSSSMEKIIDGREKKTSVEE